MADALSTIQKITRLSTDSDLLHHVVHDGPTSVVQTEGGAVPTMANAVTTLKAFNLRGEWTAGMQLALKDVVTHGGIAYVATDAQAFVSNDIAADIAAARLIVHQGATVEQLAADSGASTIGFKQTDAGAVSQTVEAALRGAGVTIDQYGAIGDGTLHPLSERFATLAAAQAFYSTVPITSLTQSIDWAATMAAINRAEPGEVVIPNRDYVYTDRVLMLKSRILRADGYSFIRSQIYAPSDVRPVSRMLFVGTGERRVETRRLYRGSALDPQDPPISTAINAQADGCGVLGVLVECACDYSDMSPTNLGAEWDVAIFLGSRLDLRLIDASTRGYWRKHSILVDATRGDGIPELNGYPVSVGRGVDGTSLVRVQTVGGYWGFSVLGPLPKPGLLHFGYLYKMGAQFTFSGQPSDGNTITIGTEVYTFRAAPVTRREVGIGADLATTIGNLITRWQKQPGRLVPYDALTLTRSGSVLQIYSTSTTATALAATGATIGVQTLGGGSAATQTVAISDPAPYYDEVSGRTYPDKRNSMGASDVTRDDCVFYSIEHHSGQAITTANPALGPQDDTCAGAMWICGLGGAAVIHRQFSDNTRTHSREPYNVKLGFCARYRQTNCTNDGSPPFSYGFVVASEVKSALIQIFGYSDPGSNFPRRLNNNQVYSHFYLDSANDITAERNVMAGGYVQAGINNSDTDTGFVEIRAGKNANGETRYLDETGFMRARTRLSPSGLIQFHVAQNGTGTLEELWRANTNSFIFDKSLLPATDGNLFFGGPAARVQTVYAVNGTINVSDATRKTPVRALTDAELAAGLDIAREFGVYQFLDAVAQKGGDAARLHPGMTVQRAIEIMQSHGLDPMRYAFICYDEWEAEPAVTVVDSETGDVEIVQPAREAGNVYSFRPTELLNFVIRAVLANQDSISSMQASLAERVAALEAK